MNQNNTAYYTYCKILKRFQMPVISLFRSALKWEKFRGGEGGIGGERKRESEEEREKVCVFVNSDYKWKLCPSSNFPLNITTLHLSLPQYCHYIIKICYSHVHVSGSNYRIKKGKIRVQTESIETYSCGSTLSAYRNYYSLFDFKNIPTFLLKKPHPYSWLIFHVSWQHWFSSQHETTLYKNQYYCPMSTFKPH